LTAQLAIGINSQLNREGGKAELRCLFYLAADNV